jgi:hypothetical protein
VYVCVSSRVDVGMMVTLCFKGLDKELGEDVDLCTRSRNKKLDSLAIWAEKNTTPPEKKCLVIRVDGQRRSGKYSLFFW